MREDQGKRVVSWLKVTLLFFLLRNQRFFYGHTSMGERGVDRFFFGCVKEYCEEIKHIKHRKKDRKNNFIKKKVYKRSIDRKVRDRKGKRNMKEGREKKI